MLQYKTIASTRSIKFPRIDLSTIAYKFHDFLRHYRIDYPILALKKFKSDSPGLTPTSNGPANRASLNNIALAVVFANRREPRQNPPSTAAEPP